MKRVLYISGSVGLGHVTRDLEIVRQLRSLNPNIEVSWAADYPASMVVEKAGERLIPESLKLTECNYLVEEFASNYELNVHDLFTKFSKDFAKNMELVSQIQEREKYDLIVGDETYDISAQLAKRPEKKTFPYVMIYDFFGTRRVSKGPKDALQAIMIGRTFHGWATHEPPVIDRQIFLGEEEDVDDGPIASFLPNARDVAKAHFRFVGYAVGFDPQKYRDQKKAREEIGWKDEPIILVTAGGTMAGKPLLELCIRTYPILKATIPDLKMMVVSGPSIPPESIKGMEGVEIRGYVPDLFKYMAAADLVVTSGGGSSMLELTALNRPFIYFPFERHCEQMFCSERCERHKAGVKMTYSKTTEEGLAKAILENIGKEVDYSEIRLDGARNAAAVINELL